MDEKRQVRASARGQGGAQVFKRSARRCLPQLPPPPPELRLHFRHPGIYRHISIFASVSVVYVTLFANVSVRCPHLPSFVCSVDDCGVREEVVCVCVDNIIAWVPAALSADLQPCHVNENQTRRGSCHRWR